MNKLGGEAARALDIAAAPPQVDPDVAALRPSKLLQALPECRDTCLSLDIALVGVHQSANATHSLWLLRARSHGTCGNRAAEQRDELAPLHHSVTSSARAFPTL